MEETRTARAPASETRVGRLHWHPSVHRGWTGRQMYFWFFTFSALYSQEEVLEALSDLYQEIGVTSYVSYELLGAFDLVARVYLDPSTEDDFHQLLDRRLAPLGLTKAQPFRVDKIERNWVWEGRNGRGEVRRPDTKALRQHFPVAEVALLNNADDDSAARGQLIERYSERNLLTEATRSYGIKFVLLIGCPDEPSGRTVGHVTGRLARALDQAMTSGLLVERSLYTGHRGQRELFLMLCRIEHRRFHDLRKGLLEPVGVAVAPIAEARTTTFPVVSEDFLSFQDEVALEEADRVDVEALLRGHETSVFEIKGSLFSPLNPWLEHGKELEESKEMPLKGVLKAIVGLLNSMGGTIVVGAVEEQRYEADTSAMERLGPFPKVGKHRVIGLVDPTYRDWGWDAWDKRLRDLIAMKIDTNPGVLVQTRLETIERQDVCVIDVFDPGADDQFYLKLAADKLVFYARQGTEVVPLQGNRIAEHCRQVSQQRESKRKAQERAKRG